MMKYDIVFDDINSFAAMWVGDATAGTSDLAAVADVAIKQAVPFVSMSAGAIKIFWPWVEGKHIKILGRFNVCANQDFDVVMSKFARSVTDAFHAGADGVQVFVPCDNMAQFVDMVRTIKSDLFFDRYLSIGIDIDNMENINWQMIFDVLNEIRPDSILIFGNVEHFDPNSLFAGRVFDMLEKWNIDSDLHLMFGKNTLRVAQVLRLVEKMRPELMKNLRVFVEP